MATASVGWVTSTLVSAPSDQICHITRIRSDAAGNARLKIQARGVPRFALPIFLEDETSGDPIQRRVGFDRPGSGPQVVQPVGADRG